ncbi:ATP-dependent RNA helicase mtr4 [Phlyctochytrium planicorne]|nr:ATP-dependent RNA helicase mtr4 [Phlyctochytrium planicorne]
MFNGNTDSLFAGFGDDEDDIDLPVVAFRSKKHEKRTLDAVNGNGKAENDGNPTKKAKDDASEPKSTRGIGKTVNVRVSDESVQGVEKQYTVRAESIGDAPKKPSEAPTTGQGDGATAMDTTPDSGQVKLAISHSVRHQVALPPDYPYIPIAQHVPNPVPARKYKFTLDPFQATAVAAIERNESVLVSAHTSAGKTVVAEYAIAVSLRDKQRVIYTSPIKALSNQKYRELQEEFGDVGLMTGDTTINPNASCLVMTTEILRSMLYRGSELMREVAWVIFDEVHYMRDKSRGVVWEETLILLPDKVHYVFLSATIPNAMQFAQWICNTHNQPCHVVFTDYRPTPLQHYLFPENGDGIHLVVDEKSVFREDNFQRAIGSLTESSGGKGFGKKKGGQQQKAGGSDLYKIIRMIMVKNYHPVIVFAFSKRECEGNALQLSKLDFNDDQERGMVANIFNNAIQCLNEDDRNLPQIEHLLPLLKRGIGIHHSGLLPILKEVIEILFQEGLIKVLFATETFSIGLNMPAKTVVFTSIIKFDGKSMRYLSGGEYIQMSGRAGRRGLDDRGIVILMVTEKLEPSVATSMLKGESDRLDSAFHLTYNMILNLLRIEGISAEYILERSFFQHQSLTKLPSLRQDMEVLQKRLESIQIDNESTIEDYYNIRLQLDAYQQDVRDVMNHEAYCLPFLQAGRVVRIKMAASPPKIKVKDNKADDGDEEEENPPEILNFGLGVIVNFQKRIPQLKGKDLSEAVEAPKYIADVLLHCAPGTDPNTKEPKPCPDGEVGEMIIVPCALSTFDGMSSIRVFTPKELKTAESRNQLRKTIKEVEKRFPDGVPMLDPFEDMNITDPGFKKIVAKIETLEKKLQENPLVKSPELPALYEKYASKVLIMKKLRSLKKKVKDTESIIQLDDLKCRRRVLRRLGFISQSDVIEVKGRVACEVSVGDELVLTEMIFNGMFADLSVDQCVALLSCFCCSERSDKNVGQCLKTDELLKPYERLKETLKYIAKVSIECKLPLDEAEYIAGFRPEMMEVVFQWCKGAKFSAICKLTEIFEGSIIRVFRMLEELLRQMVAASKSIGNTELEAKFSEGIVKIKRDIVFANSLYL